MEGYKPNSHRYKEELDRENAPEKKVEKVISGSARTKKKSGIHKITDIFIAEDIGDVKTYLIEEVLIPAFKTTFVNAVKDGIEMLVNGKNAARSKKGSTASRVSYRSYYEQENNRDQSVARGRGGYDYDDVVLVSRGDAETVLVRMDELIDVYGVVSVADFYEMVGEVGNYTDNKYGWTDIRSARVIRVRDGYMIKMPRALPLN